MQVFAVLFLVATVAGCGSASRIVARAGDQALTVDQTARIFAERRNFPLRRDMVHQIVTWWVDYQLFAQRVVSGDSMLDSATVLEAMWPAARGYVLARFREPLLADWLPLDSASVDSAYRAGDHRLIQHVLIRADSAAPPDARVRKREQAKQLRVRLGQGVSWETINRESEDAAARQRGGSIGVIRRGETPPEFEEAAFALRPGEISPVIESPFGFQLVRRPPLGEVRDEFRGGLERVVPEHVDSLYRRDLLARRRLVLKPTALEQAREAVGDPLRFRRSNTVIATFDEGRFTLADLVRWLQTIPALMHTQIERGSEQHLSWFLETMMGYELMYREAQRRNVTLSPEEFAELKDQLAGRLNQLKSVLNVYPPAPGDSASTEEREQRGAANVERFLFGDWRERFARVPVFLADKLRRESRWAVYPRAVERSLRLAAELRASADSLGRPR